MSVSSKAANRNAQLKQGDRLWAPSQSFADTSNMQGLIDWLHQHRDVSVADYDELWQWSVDNIEDFWAAAWDYFHIDSDTPYSAVVDSLEMKPGNVWFSGAKVNFAEHVLRMSRDGTAIWHLSETRPLQQLSWHALNQQVRIVATGLRARGICSGDKVVCLMPNIPETVVAMLATISIGAVWSNAAPEFGTQTILDRFSQLNPKCLFVADGYQFGGKCFDRLAQIEEVVSALPSLEQVVYLSYQGLHTEPPELLVDLVAWTDLLAGEDPGEGRFLFERVPHDHPLWVVFSSGTTGLPKAIIHNHVCVLMEMLKFMSFHLDLKSGDVSFFYTTTGWVMFNLVVGMLLTGSAVVLYDGSPTHPAPDTLWKMAADTGATLFGASPSYVQILDNLGVEPGKKFDLSSLKSVLVGGSPSTPETFAWFYQCVKRDLWVTSQSGGTEIASGFVGGSPTLPVHAGEIQARALAMAVESWNEEGDAVIDEVGELVCTKPFPSMPMKFLNDEGGDRYQKAYFEDFPGVWRHGDFIKINRRGGCYIQGRSDATLNRYGVRIGTSEVYRAVEALDTIQDSLVVCVEGANGGFFMPLFIELSSGVVLNEALTNQIKATLKEYCSPRHVPDAIYQVDAIPYTLTGKKLEVPVRKMLLGIPLEKAASRDSMKNPEAIDYFVDFADRYLSDQKL